MRIFFLNFRVTMIISVMNLNSCSLIRYTSNTRKLIAYSREKSLMKRSKFLPVRIKTMIRKVVTTRNPASLKKLGIMVLPMVQA